MSSLSDRSPVWHPFTPQKWPDAPLHVMRAQGTTLYLEDGRELIDAISSWWVNTHGHCHPLIAERIAQQARSLEHVIFAGFTHAPAQELAHKLIDLLPGSFEKVFFSDDGSTAVEVALKMALQYWHNRNETQRTEIIAFDHAYHGDTFGAMSVGAESIFNAAFQSHLFRVKRIQPPDSTNWSEVKSAFLDLLRSGQVAAFIFEPLVQGSSGMRMHDAGLLDELIGLAQAEGVLCIADEVMTGFGRTGKNFACDYLSHQPDIITLSKGITGGFLPLGVTVCTHEVYDAYYTDDPLKTFFHGHSYTANPLACAAANASMELLESADCQQKLVHLTNRNAEFADDLAGHSAIRELRRIGTILAIEIDTPDETSYLNSIRTEIYRSCLDRGVFLRPLGNVLYLMPPYCITDVELDKVYEVMRDVLEQSKKI